MNTELGYECWLSFSHSVSFSLTVLNIGIGVCKIGERYELYASKSIYLKIQLVDGGDDSSFLTGYKIWLTGLISALSVGEYANWNTQYLYWISKKWYWRTPKNWTEDSHLWCCGAVLICGAVVCCVSLQDAILKLGPLPRLLNDISVALRNPQLHRQATQQPEQRQPDRLLSRPGFNHIVSSDFQSLMMRDLNRYTLMDRSVTTDYVTNSKLLSVCRSKLSTMISYTQLVWLVTSLKTAAP